MNAQERILLVDDEQRLLEGLQRAHRADFRIDIATSPEQALQLLVNHGPYAVVVSDLRMPDVDGIEFLSIVKDCSPETVRVLLTGQADLHAAIDAVNEGSIFLFLTKPCAAATFANSLGLAINQYRLIVAERELLHETLTGTVELLTEILGAVRPELFSRTSRIRRYVEVLAQALGLEDIWQYQVAAMLSQIGCLTAACGGPASDTAEAAPGRAAETGDAEAGAALLRRIPRLGSAAQIIAWQDRPFRSYDPNSGDVAGQIAEFGAQILHLAVDLDQFTSGGIPLAEALAEMRRRDGEYNPDFLDAMESAETAAPVVAA